VCYYFKVAGLIKLIFCLLKNSITETPAIDEIDVYKTLQKCLELRDNYVFREKVAPWEKELITDPSTPKPNPNPFSYTPEEKTEVSIMMVSYEKRRYSMHLTLCACINLFFN
jgi:AMP deaminase